MKNPTQPLSSPHPGTPRACKYINPMVDFGFKKIFKESGKKQLLIRPLNEIFDLDIVDLEIRESEQLGLIRDAHACAYDLFCTDSGGRRFIVEVQLAQQSRFAERALFYTAVPIAKSMPKLPRKVKKRRQTRSRPRRWDYDYPPVFFLGLLNFGFHHQNPALADPEQYIHLFSLRDEKTHELMSDRLRFAFLEVDRFDKPKEACASFEDGFLFIMKNLSTFVQEPALWDDDPYFKELIVEAEFANMTDRQQERYLARMKRVWDYENTLDYAREEGRKEGKEKWMKEGEQKRNLDNARKMLAEGLSEELITRITGLSEEEIQALSQASEAL